MMDERELRESLERRVGTISATPIDTPKAVRRARRRLIRNGAVTAIGGAAVVVGAFLGVRTIDSGPIPVNPPTPTVAPTPGSPRALAYGIDGDIYLSDSNGADAVRIADGRPPAECRGIGEYWGEGPIWSPDGRYLAYRHTHCEAPLGWSDVVISDPKGNVVAAFPSEGWRISWSPDSTRVAVWVRVFKTIGIYGLDGERQAMLTVPPGMMAGGDYDPVWLPDGTSLLLPDDVVIPIDGSAPHTLPWLDRRPGSLTYSPDGSGVAYTANRTLVVAAADGSDPREVFGDFAWKPVWSPTGDRIAFVTSTKAHGLRVLDVTTGAVTLLAEEDGSNSLAVIGFSPEGDRILFSRAEERGAGMAALWSIRIDGSDSRRLVTGTGWGDWRPSGPTQPTSASSAGG
jgi:Tol biopolymer transport system component